MSTVTVKRLAIGYCLQIFARVMVVSVDFMLYRLL